MIGDRRRTSGSLLALGNQSAQADMLRAAEALDQDNAGRALPLENTALASVFGVNGAQAGAYDRASELLHTVGLGEKLGAYPRQLSAGQQQRVVVARALLNQPQLLLADEPTGELDFRTGVQILDLLQHQSEDGRAVLVVTHNREISRIADRVVELSSGQIVGDGPPRGGKADVADLHW